MHHLFGHLREVHALTPEQYTERCPGAPLASEELVRFLQHESIAAVDGELRRNVELFGLEVPASIVPGEDVPAQDEEYLLDDKLSRHLTLSLIEGERVLLVGPTGLGKSTLIEQLAARLHWPVVRVAASGGLTESDLLGEWVVRDGRTVFNYGFLPRAMQQGAICLVDEIDGMEPEVAFSLHQVMEEGGKLVLLQNGGETITPHERFRLVATANTLGHGDESGLYTGTKVLNAAFLDRFTSVFELGYMQPEQEAEVVARRVPECSGKVVEKLVTVAGDVRRARENDEVFCTFSTRRLIDVARKHAQLGDLQAAFQLALLNRLAPADRQVVSEVCQRHFGAMLEGGEDAL